MYNIFRKKSKDPVDARNSMDRPQKSSIYSRWYFQLGSRVGDFDEMLDHL